MLLASSRALLRRNSCRRHTRWRAVSPGANSHQVTDAASSAARVSTSMAGGGRDDYRAATGAFAWAINALTVENDTLRKELDKRPSSRVTTLPKRQ